MVCEHLCELEWVLLQAKIPVTFRGQAWSQQCREWVYFACCLDLAAIRERIQLPDCVGDHEHLGTHDGQEAGFVCNACHDAVVGAHPAHRGELPMFP